MKTSANRRHLPHTTQNPLPRQAGTKNAPDPCREPAHLQNQAILMPRLSEAEARREKIGRCDLRTDIGVDDAGAASLHRCFAVVHPELIVTHLVCATVGHFRKRDAVPPLKASRDVVPIRPRHRDFPNTCYLAWCMVHPE